MSEPSEWARANAEKLLQVLDALKNDQILRMDLAARTIEAARVFGRGEAFIVPWAQRAAEARKLLEKVAAIHPRDCNAPTCPFTEIRKWLGAS